MSLRHMTVAAVLAASAVVPAVAAAGSVQSTIAGTWKLSIIADHAVPTALVLELAGDRLTGTLSIMNKPVAVAGQLTGDDFRVDGSGLAVSGPGDHGNMPQKGVNFTIKGRYDAEENTLAGTIAIEGGPTFKVEGERLRARPTGAPAPPAAGAAASARVDLSGAWTMGIDQDGTVMDGALTLEQAGQTLTGKFQNDHLGDVVLEGTFASSGLVTLKGSAVVSGTSYPMTFTGTVQPDGSLSGELASVMGTRPWTAHRVK